MTKRLILLIVIGFISSCTKVEKIEFDKSVVLKNGEWFNIKDTLTGLSIRKNHLGYFNNMKILGDSLYQYKLVDSILIRNNKKTILNSYLKIYNNTDTIYNQILSMDKKEKITMIKNKDTIDFELKLNWDKK